MTSVNEYQSDLALVTAIIASSGTVSGAVDLGGTTLVGIQLPAAFTGTALSFQAATTLSGTYQAMIDATGSAITKTVAQGKYLVLDPAEFIGVQFLKVVSGSTEGASRDLALITRPL